MVFVINKFKYDTSKMELISDTIQGLKSDIQLSDEERAYIVEKSIQAVSGKPKCTIVMEELAELQQQVSKQIRGEGDKDGLLEEMTDVYICLSLLELE